MEQYMIWNRKKNERSHLVYAEYEKITDAGAWRNNIHAETSDVNARINDLDRKMTESIKDIREEIRGLADVVMLKNKASVAGMMGKIGVKSFEGALKKNEE
jgi:hypothetical protein